MSQAPAPTPESLYIDRLKQNRALLIEEQKRDRLLGYTKVALLLIVFVGAIALLKAPASWAYLLIPVAAFVVFAMGHDRVLQRIARLNRILAFYERGVARLHDEWAGKGEASERFLDPRHPYARDLDLFGQGSLFEMLCTARTRAGEETLARWLLDAAPLDVVRDRQQAVAELKDRVPFRERLFAAGDPVRTGVHPERLATWGETKPDLGPPWLRPLMLLLSLLWLASVGYWLVTAVELQAGGLDWITRGNWHWLAALTAINYVAARFAGPGVEGFLDSTEGAAVDLKLLAGVLEVLEAEAFEAPLLRRLQSVLRERGRAPSVAIRSLHRILLYIESRRNFLVRLVSRVTFYEPQLAFAAEAWRRRFGPSIRGWLAVVGEFEALADLSSFAYEHPAAIFPEFVEAGPLFDARDLAHPLLPEKRAVRNDVCLDSSTQLLIVSGPNMAGKSTFVRAVGINAVLAQCGSMVQARLLRLSPLAIGASICVLDSLQGGVSRFYAEIQRLKLISDMTRTPRHVLFLLDELLSGTNSHDRLAGTQFLVRALLAQGAIGLITTHDLALTRIPEAEAGRAVNCHFEDHLENGALQFDYRLKPGVVRTSNALRLMQSIGLAVEEERS